MREKEKRKGGLHLYANVTDVLSLVKCLRDIKRPVMMKKRLWNINVKSVEGLSMIQRVLGDIKINTKGSKEKLLKRKLMYRSLQIRERVIAILQLRQGNIMGYNRIKYRAFK